LRIGDVLTVPVHNSVRVVRVVSLAVRRGPATEARTLYDEIDDPA
jgi:ribosome-associated heat shock protein Hsp15